MVSREKEMDTFWTSFIFALWFLYFFYNIIFLIPALYVAEKNKELNGCVAVIEIIFFPQPFILKEISGFFERVILISLCAISVARELVALVFDDDFKCGLVE